MATPTQGESLQLSVSNFGPIAKAEIDLRPLTVFVGPSNTGKSYLAILVYALHRFFSDYTELKDFGFWKAGRIIQENIEEQQLFDRDGTRKLADWFTQVDNEDKLKNTAIQLPDGVASPLRSLFSNVGKFSPIIIEEVKRSFGIEDATKLIRHNSRKGANITLDFETFKYEMMLKRGKLIPSPISISEGAPLYIDLRTQEINEIRFWVSPAQMLNTPSIDANDDVVQKIGAHFMSALFGSVVNNAVNPLNNTAHYLPADRTGVMHSHRVVVASLIKSAPRGGLRHDSPLPELSGVLADFLGQLVGLSERSTHVQGNLGKSIEQQILKGLIRNKDSETGYPMFSYQPQGWTEDLPLMNASSMVSELAPVVLYLRHFVQPGDVLIIEEPESHLHPAMQVEFVRQLAAVVNSGIRVMLTTHSEWVLDELTNLVRLSGLPKRRREGIASGDFALNPDEVGVWLFEPKQRPKGSVVKEIRFDEEFGGFRSGFDEVAMGTYNDYAKISNRIERSSAHDESH